MLLPAEGEYNELLSSSKSSWLEFILPVGRKFMIDI